MHACIYLFNYVYNATIAVVSQSATLTPNILEGRWEDAAIKDALQNIHQLISGGKIKYAMIAG